MGAGKGAERAPKGGGVTPLCAPTPLCQNRICLTRGVSPGAYRGAQGRSFKNTWKMFVFNCMIHFVTLVGDLVSEKGPSWTFSC